MASFDIQNYQTYNNSNLIGYNSMPLCHFCQKFDSNGEPIANTYNLTIFVKVAEGYVFKTNGTNLDTSKIELGQTDFPIPSGWDQNCKPTENHYFGFELEENQQAQEHYALIEIELIHGNDSSDQPDDKTLWTVQILGNGGGGKGKEKTIVRGGIILGR